MAISSVHFNGNILCAIDVETTGLIPGRHEIVQLAAVPLAPDLTPSKRFGPFELRIQPVDLHEIDRDYKGLDRKLVQDAMVNGMERWSAVDYFSQWFYKTLRLAPGKKIVPLGCNFEAFDYPFLVEFFGGIESYQEFFRSDVRDVQRLACGINDLADWRSERIPFPKVNLAYLCSCLGVENMGAHNALYDALASAEVYRRIMGMGQYYAPKISTEDQDRFDEIATQYSEYKLVCVTNNAVPIPFRQFRRVWEASFSVVI